MPEDVRLRAGDGVFVGETHDFERGVQAGVEQGGGDGLAEAAVRPTLS